MYTGVPDSEIIRKVIQGEQHAFAELVNRYQNYVFTLVLKYVPQRQDAEELAQDVFVKAYRFLADYRGETARFSTWLYAITQNTCYSYLRKKKLTMKSLDDEKIQLQQEPSEWHESFQRSELKSTHKVLKEAMGLLSPEDAHILTLFYIAEQSLEELGMILHVDPNTAKVRLHRARRRLKEKLERKWSKETNELI